MGPNLTSVCFQVAGEARQRRADRTLEEDREDSRRAQRPSQQGECRRDDALNLAVQKKHFYLLKLEIQLSSYTSSSPCPRRW